MIGSVSSIRQRIAYVPGPSVTWTGWLVFTPSPSTSPYTLPLFGPPTATTSASALLESRLASVSVCAPDDDPVQPWPQLLRETVIVAGAAACWAVPPGHTAIRTAPRTTSTTRVTTTCRRLGRQRRTPSSGVGASGTAVLLAAGGSIMIERFGLGRKNAKPYR